MRYGTASATYAKMKICAMSHTPRKGVLAWSTYGETSRDARAAATADSLWSLSEPFELFLIE